MQDPLTAVPLTQLAVVAVRGPDARRFLNGQLSRDVLRLGADRVELAGLHNPQGRTLAIVRLVPLGNADVGLVLPGELAGEVASRLGRFVLRAKLRIADESADWRLLGAWAGLPEAGPQAGAAALDGRRHTWRHAADGRIVTLVPASTSHPHPAGVDAAAGLAAWAAADVAAGLPQVYAATAGAFVAQMLNLDVLGGISFDKGCYTGQEVIARAHYRGRVKRRLQRFATRGPAPAGLVPGSHWSTADARTLRVVDVAPRPDGSAEFLAVAPLPGPAAAETDSATTDGAGGGPMPIACDDLPLPYALPA
jgi:folate-binding protein YgfZ